MIFSLPEGRNTRPRFVKVYKEGFSVEFVLVRLGHLIGYAGKTVKRVAQIDEAFDAVAIFGHDAHLVFNIVQVFCLHLILASTKCANFRLQNKIKLFEDMNC